MKNLFLLAFLAIPALAVTPDCSQTFQLSNAAGFVPDNVTRFSLFAGATTQPINNNLGGSSCQAWTVFYSFSGISAASIEAQTASATNAAFGLFQGSVALGANPYTTGLNGYVNLVGTNNYLRFAAKYLTGIGTVTIQAFGWVNPANVGSLANSTVATPVTGHSPDCSQTFQLSNDPSVTIDNLYTFPLGAGFTGLINNNLGGSSCQAWTFLYSFSGITASSIEAQTATATNAPFTLLAQTIQYGSNPYVANANGYVNTTSTPNYLRFAAKYVSGTGTITIQAFGWINPAYIGSSVNYPATGGTLNLTTNGSSGASTYDSGTNTLNVPIYSGGGSGVSILATDSSIGWQCSPNSSPNYSLINSNTVIAATNAWFKANPSGTMYFPSNQTCLAVGQTSTSSIVNNTMMLGVTSGSIIGDNTVLITTTEFGANNLNFQSGQSDWNCFSGSVTNPTVNYDYTAAPIATVGAGSTTVTATGFTGAIGDEVLIYGFDQQNSGFPPNYRYFERHYVTGISGTTITLDAPLTYSYNAAWPYNAAVNTTVPSIRDISPNHTCPGGGTVQRPHYLYVQGFDFSQTIPSQSGQIPTVYAGGADYVEFDNVKFGYFSPEGGGTIVVRNSTYQWIELDKGNEKFFSINSTVTGNVQTPSDAGVVSGSGTLYTEWDSNTFKAQVAQASRTAIYNDSTFYSQASSPYGFVSNGQAGFQSTIEMRSPKLYKNGVSQSGIFSAGNGYQITVAAVPTSSTFTVATGANSLAVQQYVGPNTRFYDHTSGVYLGYATADPYLNAGVMTVPTSTFLGGNALTMSFAACAGCSGWVTGDLATITGGGGTGAQFTVTASAGVVTAITRTNGGAGYSTGSALSTSRLSGSGVGTLTVNIASVGSNPQVGQAIDINTNAQNVKVSNPIAMDFDINSIPPAFDSGINALINNFQMDFGTATTVTDLGTCNASSTFATKKVVDAFSQSFLGSGGNSTPTSVYCIGTNQFTGTWVTTSAITTPFLNGISTATANATLNSGIYNFVLTSTQLSPTSGNGSVVPPTLGFVGTKGQNTTGTTGQQAGTGQTASCVGGAGGDAPSGSLIGYGGDCDLEAGASGGGSGTGGGLGSVTLNKTVAGKTLIGGAGGFNCMGTIALTGTCGNGLFNNYFSGNTLHTGQLTLNGALFNTSITDSKSYATVASASTMTVTAIVNKVTGTSTINSIPALSGCVTSTQNCDIVLIADPATGPFTLASGTNIYLPNNATTFVATIGQAVQLNYDSTALRWYCVGCASGSGGSYTPPVTTKGDLFTYSTTPTRLGVGADTFILTADSTQATGLKWAAPPTGTLPSQTGNAGLWLTTNGSSASWSDLTTGPSGALCAGTGCSGGTAGQVDIITSVVPRLAAANPWTGANDFSGAALIKIKVGTTAPPCSVTGDEGSMWLDTTTATANHLKVCAEVSSTIGFQTIF